MLNKRVGRYKIVEKLAQGGMGEVYLARHELMGRDAVVKVLHPKLSHDADLVARFFNEAKAAAQIEHPGIVQVYDLARTEDGRAFIVMERLRGQTLAQRIERGPLTVEHSVAIARQLASALGAAHSQNIVHRDLKPENIFLVPDPDVPEGERVKVVDFGVAKLVEKQEGQNQTATGSIFGTPAYMAPEQCADAARVDHRADLYAIGCILYELICGEPPFGRGGLELLAAQLRDQPPPPREHNPAIPEDVEAAILCLLAKDPEERFQNCSALIRALGGADMSVPVDVPPALEKSRELALAATFDPRTGAHGRPAAGPADTVARDRERSSQPTTYRRASGQIARNPDPGAGRGGGMALAALAVLLLAAGGAFAVVSQTRRAAVESHADPSDPTWFDPDTEPGQPDGPDPIDPAYPGLARAQKALDTLRWEDAVVAARVVLDAGKAPPEVRARAEQILVQARRGQSDLYDYQLFVEAIGSSDVGNVARAYEQLTESNPYRDKAETLYAQVRDEWLEPRLARAEKFLDKNRCKPIDELAVEVGFHFPESARRFHKLYRSCRRKLRDDKGSTNEHIAELDGDTASGETGEAAEGAGSTGTNGTNGTNGTREPEPEGQQAGGDTAGGTQKGVSPRKPDQNGFTTVAQREGDAEGDPPTPAANLPAKLDKSEFKRKMKRAEKLLQKRCARWYAVKGKQRVTLEIAARGDVTAASITHDNEDFRECVEGPLRTMRFEPARQPSTMNYTMKFRAEKIPKAWRDRVDASIRKHIESSEPESKPGAEPESTSGSKPESRPGAKPESRPGVAPESRPGVAPESRPGAGPESKPEAAAEAKPRPKAKAKAKAKARTRSKARRRAKAGP